MKIEVYLAGRMSGKTVKESMQWRRDFVEHFGESTSVLVHNPCYLLDESMDNNMLLSGNPPGNDHYFGGVASYQRDLWMVDKCDVVVANLTGDDWMSLGTIFELGYAKKAGKLIIAICKPGDYAANHLFVQNACTIVSSLSEAITHIENISEGPSRTKGH